VAADDGLLDVRDLRISYSRRNGAYRAVQGVSLSLHRGGTLCLVGESGSGKTSIAMSIPRLLPETAAVEGSVLFDRRDLLSCPRSELYEVRRRSISVVFQDAIGSLVPGTLIGVQLRRALVHRLGGSQSTNLDRTAEELLAAVGLVDPARVTSSQPHELSAGMCQRVMIALALSARPSLLIADEPLSSLDAISQVRVLDLLFELRLRYGYAILFVTHDLRVARRFEQLGVLREGRLVDYGTTTQVLSAPSSEYTRELLSAGRSLSGSQAH